MSGHDETPERGTVIHLSRAAPAASAPVACDVPLSSERHKRVKIFPVRATGDIPDVPETFGSVFVTIGPAETRVSILDEQGDYRGSWVAIFGWCDICDIGVIVDGQRRPFEDPALISQAMRGSVRMFGREVDTADFLKEGSVMLERLLDDILTRTVGSGAPFDAIVLSAPAWMRDILKASTSIRPHIFTEIDDEK